MIRRVSFLLLSLAACDGAVEPPRPWSEPPPAPVDLRVTVAPLEVPLLQPITVTLDRFRLDGVEVDFSPEVDGGSFVTRSTTTGPERRFGDGFWQRTTMVLLPFAGPGELQLPAFFAEVRPTSAPSPLPPATTTPPPDPTPPRLRAMTPATTITVTSALAGHGGAIEAPGEPFPAPFGGFLWLAGAALVALSGGVVWWQCRPLREAHVEVAVPPHVAALRELQRLRQTPRATHAEVERFYVDVSQALRVYLEQRFGLRAPERTTEEFLRELEDGDLLARRHRAELERFLAQCDLVKFAAVLPAEADHLAAWELAHAFVEATRADRVGGAGADAPAAAAKEGSP